MARTIRTIEAVASSTGMEVDRDAGIIHGVKILGLVSDNNRKYMPEAVRKAKSLYEGIKVNIDHPAESGDVRSAEDRFGKLINVKYVEGEGLYGDLMFLKSHPMAERICEAAERNDMNDTFGLSHNAQGDGQEDDDGCFVVSSIVEVRHVDLVADPATTKSLRESLMKTMERKETSGKKMDLSQWKNLITTKLKTGEGTWMETKVKEATDFDAIKKFQDTLKNATTKQVLAYHIGNTGGKIKSKDYTAAEVGGKQAMIGDILRSKFGSKAVEEFFAQENAAKKTKKPKLGESDMSDDEDETMTEASGGEMLSPIIQEVTSNIEKSKEALKAAMIKGATIRNAIKGPSGAKITAELTKLIKDASGQLDTLSMRVQRFGNFLAWANESVESNDEDEMMTEAEDMPVEDPLEEEEMTESNGGNKIKNIEQQVASSVKELQTAYDSLQALIKNDAGPKTKQALEQVKKELGDAFTAVYKLKGKLSSMGSKDFSETEDMDDEDEMMTEANENEGHFNQLLSQIKELAQKAIPGLSPLYRSINALGAEKQVGGKTRQKLMDMSSLVAAMTSDLLKIKAEASKITSQTMSEAEGDPEDDMPMDEADGMSIDDITDKPAVEAYDKEDDMPVDEADDEEKMAMESSSDNVGKTSREWDAHFEKQSPKMQSAINVGLHRGLSYPDAAKRAKSLVKEAIADDEEDKMAMESKRRRLNTFCRNNGVTLTEGLYKDLRLLPDIAQRRCILRIKLASKARKPRSSGSMMPMTESKVHTGDNVFNWLRS